MGFRILAQRILSRVTNVPSHAESFTIVSRIYSEKELQPSGRQLRASMKNRSCSEVITKMRLRSVQWSTQAYLPNPDHVTMTVVRGDVRLAHLQVLCTVNTPLFRPKPGCLSARRSRCGSSRAAETWVSMLQDKQGIRTCITQRFCMEAPVS